MNESIILGLLHNTAILLAFSMLYDYWRIKNEGSKSLLYKIAAGIAIGGFGIILMLTPWTLIPGIVFDTRSVLLSVTGLFFGSVPTIIAMIIIGIYRIIGGGDGIWMGLAVIISSGTIGIVWKKLRPKWKKKNYVVELLILGIFVHVVMLGCTLFLPSEKFSETLRTIALPVIIVYPVSTILLGLLMINRSKNWQVRKNLLASEERWQFALEGSGDGIWDWYPQTDEVFFSKQWKAMLGFGDLEISNNFSEWDKRIHPDDKDSAFNNLNKHLNGETSLYISEHRLLCKNGAFKWILDRGKVLSKTDDGKPLRVIGVHTDITEQKHIEEEIKKLNIELEQRVNERTAELSESRAALLNLVEDLNIKSNLLEQSSAMLQAKNKELETFTYSVSHDLKAPLRGIDGYSKLLQEFYADKLNDEAQHFINTIRSSARQMNQLIEDLLAYSRLERATFRNSDIKIKDVVDNLITLFNDDIKKHKITFFVNVPDVNITADPSGLNIILRNLIENAIKFSRQTKLPEIEITLQENVSSWLLSVKDNGIGFDMKYEHRIFEIFQRLNLPEQFPGTGVGLAMVKKAVQRMGGKICANSNPGEGAVFYFEIPKQQ